MTAGFTYDLYSENLKQAWADTDGRCPTRETMKYLAKDPLAFEPGTAWNYSLCHDVLAALVEVLSGMKFEEYVRHTRSGPRSIRWHGMRSSAVESVGYQFHP